MPNTINVYSHHNLVVVKDKLFVIGTESCEVFDNVCKKFVSLKKPYTLSNKAMSIGNKIMTFQENKSSVVCYDVDKDEWSEESCDATKDLNDFSLTKIPRINVFS